MATWANQEGAADCLQRAEDHLANNDTTNASKWVDKSLSMFVSDAGKEMKRKVDERIAHEAVCRRVMNAPDLFGVLEVDRTASADEIKRAFLKLSMHIHPDKNGAPQAGDAFKRANEAKTVLTDDHTRMMYARKYPPPRTGAPPARRQPGNAPQPGPSRPPPPPPPQQPPQPQQRQQHQHQQHQQRTDSCSKLQELSAKLSAKLQELSSKTQQLAEAQGELERTRAAYSSERARHHQTDALRRAAEVRVAELERALAQLSEERHALNTRLHGVEMQAERCAKEAADANMRCARREAEIGAWHTEKVAQLRQAEDSLAEQQDSVARLTAALQDLQRVVLDGGDAAALVQQQNTPPAPPMGSGGLPCAPEEDAGPGTVGSTVATKRRRDYEDAPPDSASSLAIVMPQEGADKRAIRLPLLRLRPLKEDGRDAIILGQGFNALILGRNSRDSTHSYAVRDPRVSRKHVRLDLSDDCLRVAVTALGANPVGVLPNAYSDTEAVELLTLKQGQQKWLLPGDIMHLVIEERCPPIGQSAEWAGNPCGYVVERVPDADVSVARGELEEQMQRGSLLPPPAQAPCAASPPVPDSRPYKLARGSTCNGENQPPSDPAPVACAPDGDVPGGSHDDPILCL